MQPNAGYLSAPSYSYLDYQIRKLSAPPACAFLDVTKAAALSSAMLTRKQSVRGRGESFGVVADLLSDEPEEQVDVNAKWCSGPVPQKMLALACFLSLISVSMNTPKTFEQWGQLRYITFGLDIFITAVFTVEAVIKIRRRGLIKQRRGYIRDRWCQFDFFMLVCHWLSVIVQAVELMHLLLFNQVSASLAALGLLRSPRPLIMVRLIRSVLNIQLPKNRISQIFKRSSQQVYNVTIFFLFFMSLYAILGVQFFGRMDYHCVKSTANLSNISVTDLAIPDTLCSPSSGYKCPKGMRCARLNLPAATEGFYGMFNNFAYSVFSVYMAASQEGWVYVMYDCIDSLPSWKALIYFTTLIFFLAWLVKNVFIAVITETFAEIRVQFSQMWGSIELMTEEEIRQILVNGDDSWRLVPVDANKPEGWAPKAIQEFHRSTTFQILVMVLVLSNSIVNATRVYKHDASDEYRKQVYYYMEFAFTMVFDAECLFKIWCLGWKGYMKRGLHKFELTLCIGSSLNIIKPLYDRNVFTYCQVFRVLRLIKASPMLEDFVYKIFGPGKKLGGLVVFTMALLLITSSISLQLFCFLEKLDKFRTLPEALMSMFQIMTQEGWTDVVVDTMRSTEDAIAPFVAIYFVAYHLFVTLIVLSLFVAVILDNLEMDEELKKLKQLKAREQTTSSRTKLPLRLSVFARFPDRPEMVVVKRMPSEFPLPKVRQSFTKQFTDDDREDGCEENLEVKEEIKPTLEIKDRSRIRIRQRARIRLTGHLTTKSGMAVLLHLSNKRRVILSDSTGAIPLANRHGSKQQRENRKPQSTLRKSVYKRGLHSSTKLNKMYDHLKENGDLNSPSDSARQKETNGEIDFKAMQQKKQQAEMTRNRLEEEMKENHPYFDRPLFALARDSKFRKFCQNVVHAQYAPTKTDPTTGKLIVRKYKELHELLGMMTYLDWTMFFLTCISCISMLMEKPWPIDGRDLVMNNVYLQISEYFFVIGMTFELALKLAANGLLFTPKAVVRDFGGLLTVFIYATSLIFLIWMPKHVTPNSGAQLLMIFRAMRPLRICTLVPHIRRVVVELVKGFKEILLVTVLLVVLMFVFASYGVQIAGGKLAKCNDFSIKTREECVGEFMQMVQVTRLNLKDNGDPSVHPSYLVPRVWANPRNFDFDHIGNAMLALFEILSFKGWTVVRDVVLERLGAWAAIFVHIYVFIGCMIGLTLFVGVVIANYSENRGTALLTVDQRRWNDLKNRLKMAQPLHIPPKPTESSRIRTFLYRLSLSTYFKRFFTMCVLLNSTLLCIPWNSEEEVSETGTALKALVALSALFTLLFTLEVICKMVAFTPQGFWQSRRNRVDLVITVLGIIWIAVHFIVVASTRNDIWLKEATYMFGYVLVVMRFFTIAGRNSTLKMLMLTVFMSMFRSFFIIMAMFLLMLFYAYAGVILFGMVKYGQAVGRHANFRTPTNALSVLFRIVTGEDWNEIMHDCMRSPPYCWYYEGAAYWQTDCGNYHGAILYFCSFYLIITYIVLNLLVAIIMENFSLFYSSEEDALLSYADIRNFQNVWNIVDRQQKGVIPVKRVKFLLRLLKGRLEVDPEKDRLLFKHMCHEMERLHNGDDVSFHDILIMLSYRSVDIRKHLQLEELIQREELEYVIEEEVAKKTMRSWLESCLRKTRQKQTAANNLRVQEAESAPQHRADEETMGQKSGGNADAEGRRRKRGLAPPRILLFRRNSACAATEYNRRYLSATMGMGDAMDKVTDIMVEPPRYKKSSTFKGSENVGLQPAPIVVVERSQSANETINYVRERGGSNTSSHLLSPGPLADGTTLPTSLQQPTPTVATATSLVVPQLAYAPDVKNWWKEQLRRFDRKLDFVWLDEESSTKFM